MPTTIVAIDLGTHSLKAVQIKTSLRRFEMTGYFEFMRKRDWNPEGSEPPSIEEEITQFFDHLPFRGEQYCCSLSSDLVLFRNVSLPFIKGQRIEDVARYAIEEEVLFDIENLLINVLPRETGEKRESHLMLMGVEKGIVADRIDLFSNIGIQLEGIDLDACGLAHLASLIKVEPEKTVAMVDIGAIKTTVSIVKGGQLQMVRAIPLGGDDFTKELSRRLEMEPEDAERMKKASDMVDYGPSFQEVFGHIARELALLFEAYQLQLEAPPVASIYLTGGSSALAGVEDHLSNALSLPCELTQPLDYMPHSLKNSQGHIPPQMATAMGLAIGMSFDGKRERGNFRKDEFGLRSRFGMTRRKIGILACGPLILLGLLFADFFIHLHSKEDQLKRLNGEIRSLFREAFPQAGKIPDEVVVIEMRRKIEEEKSKGLQLLAADESSRSINLLREVSLRIPMSLKMVLTELEIDRKSIRVAGETDSFENIDKVKEKLLLAPLFGDFKLLGAKQNSKSRLIEFRFRMERK
jgi:type IV pilus assembly protein PilM